MDSIPEEFEKERQVLLVTCKLYGLYQIEEQAGGFLKCTSVTPSVFVLARSDTIDPSDGYFKREHLDAIEIAVNDLCAELRAVAGTS